MSDTTELEERIKKQREEYASLKNEVEMIRSENVTKEYIEAKWEELKRQNKVVSPPDTPSSSDNSNNDQNQAQNTDHSLNILDMDEYMKRFQKPEISHQSNLDQSEQSILDQSEQSILDQSEQSILDQSEGCNIDQSEAMEVEISGDQTDLLTCDAHTIEQEVDKTECMTNVNEHNIVEYETSNECDADETVEYSQPEDDSPKNEEKCQTPMEIEETIEMDVEDSNFSNHDNGSSNHDNGSSNHDNDDETDKSQSMFDKESEPILNDDFDSNDHLKKEDVDQIIPSPDADLKEATPDQSEHSILDQSEQSMLDQSEQSSIDQSEPSSVEKKESPRKYKNTIKKEITVIKRTSSRSGVKSIMTLWHFVANHRYANLFLQKVTDEMAPGYSSVVHRTSDLSKLRRLIENGNLEDSMHFQHEMMLMFTNALFFNSADDDISRFTLEIFDDYLAEQQRFVDSDLMPDSNFVEFQMAEGEDSNLSIAEPWSSRSRGLSAPPVKRRRIL